MITLARKSTGVGILYLCCLVISVLLSVSLHNAYALTLGIFVSVISLIILADYIRVPIHPVMLDQSNRLILPKNTIISPKDIIDVSYRRASARGIQYKWGTISIVSDVGTYKFRYIKDCEEVAKTILKLAYGSKADDR